MNGIQNSNIRYKNTFKGQASTTVDDNKPRVQIANNDPYMKWPLRGLAYTNELGECLRPVIGSWAWAFWAPAVAYIGADVSDKYKHTPDGKEQPSKKRAAKQLSFQTLASVLLPTAAVKFGNYAVNRVSSFGKSNISLSDKDGILSTLATSLRNGTHQTSEYITKDSNTINRDKYINHIVSNFKNQRNEKTAKIFKKEGTVGNVARFLKKYFAPTSSDENLKKYATETINEALDIYESLAKGEKHSKISDKQFESFQAKAKTVRNDVAASKLLEKMQKMKSFKQNKALIAAGGFVSLGLLMKPIDNFVENTLIEKYIGPTITNFDKSQPFRSFKDAINFQRDRQATEQSSSIE